MNLLAWHAHTNCIISYNVLFILIVFYTNI